MNRHSSCLNYYTLQGMKNNIMGFVKLTSSSLGLHMTLHAEGIHSSYPLRILLSSADVDGAVLNLGRVYPNSQGVLDQSIICPTDQLTLWDAICLAEDWPSSCLLSIGDLNGNMKSYWRFAETISHFLSVPIEAPPLFSIDIR